MGVMAIIGILAAVLLPSMISRIEDANSVGEDAKLEEIARALVVGIKASGTIPNPNRTPYDTGTNGGGWGDIAKNYTTLTDDSVKPGTLHYVFAEETQNDSEPSARRVYLDDQFMAYLDAATALNAPVAGGVTGVFRTPEAGWPEQAGGVNLANIPLRMYIVSSSKKDLSLSCQANQSGTGMVPSPQPAPLYATNLIRDLQNWVKKADGPTDPSPGAIKVPDSIAEWGSAYAGGGNYHTRGEFLHVKVVDLRPLFCRVDLTDTAAPVVVDMANNGSGYNSVPTSTNTNGTTINYQTNAAREVLILNSFPAQRQSGLTGRGTNSSFVTNRVADPGGMPTTYATNRIYTPGAPQFEISSLGVTTIPNQQTNFYLLQGTILRLISPTNSTTIPFTIQKDCQFEYYGVNWRQLY
jgi:type II secretory pathway pseudopilin PulG